MNVSLAGYLKRLRQLPRLTSGNDRGTHTPVRLRCRLTGPEASLPR